MSVWMQSLLPGGVVALIAGLFTVWQARVGIRPAERAGFREDFQALVVELRRSNDGLQTQNAAQAVKIGALEAKIDELTIETRALGGYTRVLIRELRDQGMAVPTYQPPPDLTKHLIP